jgi:hypothetical protein
VHHPNDGRPLLFSVMATPVGSRSTTPRGEASQQTRQQTKRPQICRMLDRRPQWISALQVGAKLALTAQ